MSPEDHRGGPAYPIPRAFRWVVPQWEAGLVPVRWMAPAGSLRGLHSASRLTGVPAAAAGAADLDRQVREHLPHANVPWPGGRLYDPEGSPYRADHVEQYIRGACPCFGTSIAALWPHEKALLTGGTRMLSPAGNRPSRRKAEVAPPVGAPSACLAVVLCGRPGPIGLSLAEGSYSVSSARPLYMPYPMMMKQREPKASMPLSFLRSTAGSMSGTC